MRLFSGFFFFDMVAKIGLLYETNIEWDKVDARKGIMQKKKKGKLKSSRSKIKN